MQPSNAASPRLFERAQAMADQVSDDMRAAGKLFPDPSNVLQTEVTTAVRVVEFRMIWPKVCRLPEVDPVATLTGTGVDPVRIGLTWAIS